MNTKVIFIIAFFAVITGVYGVIDTLIPKQEAQGIEEASVVNEDIQYITLWRAKKDLLKATPVLISQLKREQVVLNDAIQLGIKKDVKLDFTVTTLLNSNINQGELVLPEHQLSKGQTGYIDLLIDDGMTIYPLQITTKNLIENFIKPGDYIDIMTVSSPVNNLAESGKLSNDFRGVNASLFMKRIKVINIDYQVQPADAASNNQKEANIYTTVVIEVDSLTSGTELSLSGPGIQSEQAAFFSGLTASFVSYLKERQSWVKFPLGVDFNHNRC